MQFNTSIPQGWELPKFWLGQRTEQGLIVGVEYCPPDTLLAEEYGKSLCSNSKCKIQNAKLSYSSILNFEFLILNCFGWRYIVLPNKNSEELHHYFDDELKPLSTSKLQKVLQEELEQYQQRITNIQQQLTAIAYSSGDNSHR
ncbi:hypothetical protein H6G80_24890 [Nostoc sp. FACHB-87]|uniref:hypothetical protein n=1 Tax=Nostocaceae TaxID=1162 RepID=UPI001686FC38|nr:MULTISPECIES: hypothetical protein [Nostocaceae]MBD2457300.1 hypothetical protein [Nostoc sp. FACHB-87]MBD2478369.1 hypothetical protein [Anabaena sp. FACHB-83]